MNNNQKDKLPSDEWDKYHHKVGAVILAICLAAMIIAGVVINHLKQN